MIKIALTGGMGTGKTFISKHFIDMGIPVFYADEEARKLYSCDAVINFCKKHFETDFFTHNQLDLSKVASVIFSNEIQKRKLEQFLHPLVMERFKIWAAKQSGTAVIMESAIIFEASLNHYFDKIIVVDAPLSVRIERIKKSYPQLSEAAIKQRFASQMSQEEKCRLADLVIRND